MPSWSVSVRGGLRLRPLLRLYPARDEGLAPGAVAHSRRACYDPRGERKRRSAGPRRVMSDHGDSSTTTPERGVPPAAPRPAGALPAYVGRYRVERLLGEGGFGR